MLRATPTTRSLAVRPADFPTLTEALDYAAQGEAGLNFHSGRGELVEVLTYRDLRDQARAAARRMLRSGLRRSNRVAVVAETDGDFVRTFFACLYAHLVPVPLPLPLAFAGAEIYRLHIRRTAMEAGVSAAFAPANLLPWIKAALAEEDLRFLGTLADLDSLPEDGIDLAQSTVDDLCYLQFSSGSTRFPMGVCVTHRALMSNIAAMVRHGIDLRPGDRCASWLPMYHDMGLVGFLLGPMASQMSVDYLATRDFARRPLLWLSLIHRHGITVSYSPSFGYEMCARGAGARAPELDLSSWRVAGIGGDMIRHRVFDRFAEVFEPFGFRRSALVASYGMAEATLAISFAPLDQGLVCDRVDLDLLETARVAVAADETLERAGRRTRKFVLCGRVLPGHEIAVRGDDGRNLPERHAGRIFVRGPSIMQGYFGRPDETAVVLDAQGWLDTGDVGYQLGDQLVLTGRAKDLIIVNGRNIWPQDLEWTVEQETEGLRSGDVAAFSIDADDKEVVVLLVQCRTKDPAARDALRRSVGGLVRESHGIESRVILVPPHSLPRTSSGKLSRRRARQMFLEGTLAAASCEAGE